MRNLTMAPKMGNTIKAITRHRNSADLRGRVEEAKGLSLQLKTHT
ncbi:MAG: hypothetical protein RL187_1014 [Actinomycetota bacterium]